jgi:hypothetical protein
MPYSQDNRNELLTAEESRLNRDLTICRDVKETIFTPGWLNTIGPLIDRMIIDVVGGKIGDTWTSGKLDRAKKEERREFYVGYKQALIDLHSRIMFHKDQITVLEERLKQVQKSKEEKYRVPLVDDTRYKLEE